MIQCRQIADVKLPTRWADFRLLGFQGFNAAGCREAPESAIALVLGDIYRCSPIVRIHSQCTTGDVFHSLRCDCHDQLHLALRTIARAGAGILVYEHQEGRGIGLMEKLRAYELQDQGLDTIEANLNLGHPVDRRSYRLPIEILRHLRVTSLRLMTDNPDKISVVRSSGIKIVERLSAEVQPTPHSAHYLATKREKLGHLSKTPTRVNKASENPLETAVTPSIEPPETTRHTMTLG